MNESGRAVVPGSKTGQSPTRKTVEQFLNQGGYAILESKGYGETPAEKQMNGWKKRGIFAELATETRISRPTLYRIASWFPTQETPGLPEGIWLKKDDFSQLDAANSELKDAEGLLKEVQKRFGRSIIIDTLELRARREILGESAESFQESLRKQLEADEKKESVMERNLNDALGKLQQALTKLNWVIFKIRDRTR